MDKGSQKDNGLQKGDCTFENGVAKAKAEGEETAQIDDLIGSFGKYQFLIFIFKILIG